MSDRRASGATRNEDKPDPCEVKLNEGKRQSVQIKYGNNVMNQSTNESSMLICKNCGRVVKSQKMAPGCAIAVAIWVALCLGGYLINFALGNANANIGGLILTLVIIAIPTEIAIRLSTVAPGGDCQNCKGKGCLIDLNSPMGKKIHAETQNVED